jgi:hypothetical protein
MAGSLMLQIVPFAVSRSKLVFTLKCVGLDDDLCPLELICELNDEGRLGEPLTWKKW